MEWVSKSGGGLVGRAAGWQGGAGWACRFFSRPQPSTPTTWRWPAGRGLVVSVDGERLEAGRAATREERERRLRYRLGHMGMKELDLGLKTVAEEVIGKLDDAELSALEEFIWNDSPSLFQWLGKLDAIPQSWKEMLDGDDDESDENLEIVTVGGKCPNKQ